MREQPRTCYRELKWTEEDSCPNTDDDSLLPLPYYRRPREEPGLV